MTYGMHKDAADVVTAKIEIEMLRATLAMIGLQAGLALTIAEDPAVRRALLRIADLTDSQKPEPEPKGKLTVSIPGYPVECPKCHSHLVGAPIYQSGRPSPEHGGATHFSRAIVVSDLEVDRATHWGCPDCGHRWGRS